MSLPNLAASPDRLPSGRRANVNQHNCARRAALDDAAAVTLNIDGTVTTWDRAAEHVFGMTSDKTVGKSIFYVLPHLAPDHLPELVKDAVRGHCSATVESTRHDGARLTTASISVAPILDDACVVTGVSLLVHDISEGACARDHQTFLVQELNHRVKNIMAIVQSLAMQVFETRPSSSALRDDFLTRLAALARSHALLYQGDWRVSSLHDVIIAQVAPHCAANPSRCSLSGPAINVRPVAAVAMGMAMHELATNAAKYGAFSTPNGQVEIAWQVTPVNGESYLHLSWQEIGGPPVEPPKLYGLGSRMIERGLAYELGGDARLYFDHSGVRYVLTAPLAAMGAPK